jgi:membrane fusion protein, heavy metal efflux system
MKTNAQTISGRIVVSGLLMFMAMTIFTSCDRKSSDQKEQTSSTAAPDKCVHNASVKVCFICDASLRDPKRLWCKEHSAYEDRCFKCHPEAQDKARLFCNEHSLYEDECFLCHPEILQPATQSQKSESSNSTAQCKEHGVAEIECGICHPELLSQKQVGEGLKIRFESVHSAEKAGVVVAQPEISTMEGGNLYPARTSFNENEASVVAARFSGTLTSVKVDLGARVNKGQIIATIASAEYASLVAEYRSADQDARVKESEYQREMELFKRNATSRQDRDNVSVVYTRAQNLVDALRQKLINAVYQRSRQQHCSMSTLSIQNFRSARQ